METFLPLIGGWVIGTVLGLLGGGGALMAIPVLIYLFDYPFRTAVGSSLVLVALGILPALVLYWRQKQVDWPSALWMGVAGMVGAGVASRFSDLFPQPFLLGLLMVLMAVSAFNLLQGKREEVPEQTAKPARPWALPAAGLAIGVLTGLVGVGGGFLLVPALLFFGGLTARAAIATSLVVIGMNAVSGAVGYLDILPLGEPSFCWLMGGSLLGSGLGFLLNRTLSEQKLKRAFAVLLLALIVLLLVLPPT